MDVTPAPPIDPGDTQIETKGWCHACTPPSRKGKAPIGDVGTLHRRLGGVPRKAPHGPVRQPPSTMEWCHACTPKSPNGHLPNDSGGVHPATPSTLGATSRRLEDGGVSPLHRPSTMGHPPVHEGCTLLGRWRCVRAASPVNDGGTPLEDGSPPRSTKEGCDSCDGPSTMGRPIWTKGRPPSREDAPPFVNGGVSRTHPHRDEGAPHRQRWGPHHHGGGSPQSMMDKCHARTPT